MTRDQRLMLIWLQRLLAIGCFEIVSGWYTFLSSLSLVFRMKLQPLTYLQEDDYKRKGGHDLLAAGISNHLQKSPIEQGSRTLEQIQKIVDSVLLSEMDHCVLQVMVLTSMDVRYKEILESMRIYPEQSGRHRQRLALCTMLSSPFDLISVCLSPKGTLLSKGLLIADEDGELRVSQGVTSFIRDVIDDTSFVNHIVGERKRPVCSLVDFMHLGDSLRHIRSLLANAAAQKSKGINLLIFGPSGSGKSELASVIADSIGCSLHGVCDSPEGGEAPERAERIQTMMLCQHMLSERGDTLLVMDEADDVLSENWSFLKMLKRSATSSYSKIFLTRMLEENTLPVIWILNDISGVDPALLRRMSFALRVPIPNKQVRARIWEKALSGSGIEASHDEVDQLAADLESGPAVAATAIRVSQMLGGDFCTVGLTAHSIASAMQGGGAIVKKAKDANFDKDLICGGGQEFEALYDRSSQWRDSPVSFCISGPSGTGKSLALRSIAKQMQREVMVCRASSLLDMYVGETEKNIANAFSAAQSEGLFLIIDEAETLLGDRRRAERRWEASMTAEFLTWMEQHPLPFGVTTNHVDLIDPAMLRRFTFKLDFQPMSSEQRTKAFERFFGAKPPIGLMAMHGLTAGDFAVTAKRARMMGFTDDALQCLNALGEELDAKGSKSRAVGFLTPLSRSVGYVKQDVRKQEAY